MAAILNSAILNLAILESAILVFPLKLTHICKICSHHLNKKNLHSFIHTELDDDSHLEFWHVGFRHCNVRFRHLVAISEIHSKNSAITLNSDSNLFILSQTHALSLNFMMAALLNSSILRFDHLGISHLGFSSQTHSWLWLKTNSHHLHKSNLTHSFSLNLMMAAILNSAILDLASAIVGIKTSFFLPSDSLKNTLTPLWLWLKLI